VSLNANLLLMCLGRGDKTAWPTGGWSSECDVGN